MNPEAKMFFQLFDFDGQLKLYLVLR